MGKTTFNDKYNPEDFAKPGFWKAFYADNKAFNWYGNLSEYMPIIKHLVKPDCKVLQVGCGNAGSEYELYDAGFEKVHNIDIDDSVIKQKMASNETKVRPGLTYSCEDATKLTAADSSFDFVFDKGTLDALMPPGDAENASFEVPTRMLDEALRVLKPKCKYIIISLAQEHILNFIYKYYQNRADILLWFYSLEVLDDSGIRVPAAIYQFHKLPQPMPKEIPKVMKFYINLDNLTSITVSLDEMKSFYLEQRKLAFFTNACRYSLEHIARITLRNPHSNTPRWTFMVYDKVVSPKTWAFVVIPPDNPRFNMDDASVRRVAAQTTYERVIVAAQHEGCDYGEYKDIEDEIEMVAGRFRPLSGESGAEVAYCYDDGGKEEKVDEGVFQLCGRYSVYNYTTDGQDGFVKTIRRLIFEDAPEIVQSDALVRPMGDDDKLFGKVDILGIISEYQRLMIAACDMRPGALIELPNKSYDIAVIGVAGGSLVTYLHNVALKSKITAVEIVPELYDVGRKWFGYPEKDDERLVSIVADGLKWLQDENTGSYDIIYVDVSSFEGESSICPSPDFVTEEIMSAYKKHLKKHGYVVVNIVSRDITFTKNAIGVFGKHFNFISVGDTCESANRVLVASDTAFNRPRDYTIMRAGRLPLEMMCIYEYTTRFDNVQKKKSDEDEFLPPHVLNNGKPQQKKKNKKKNKGGK